MKSIETVMMEIDANVDDMCSTMIEMISYPALAPVNGGDGEGRKADYLMTKLDGFDSVVRVDVPDDLNPDVMRSNILAKKNGKGKGTLWIVAHMDVVPTGDPSLWDTPPFKGILKDGCIYGRGTEDNGQSIISSLFASRPFLDQDLEGMSLGVAYVADEETTSKKGIVYLLDHGYFSKDDAIMVPDWCSPDGSQVEIAEKNLLWPRFIIEGKTTHGSTPEYGINAYRVSTEILHDLMHSLPERFNAIDNRFIGGTSTFEPTKRPATVENINTIPGYDEFSMDMRLLPCYDPDEVLGFVRDIAVKHAERTGAKITVEVVECHVAGNPSSLDSPVFEALVDSIESVIGKRPTGVGIGGGTCANFFRLKGFDAYVWQSGKGSLHAPNEHVVLSDLITDTKVYASLIHRMCLQGLTRH